MAGFSKASFLMPSAAEGRPGTTTPPNPLAALLPEDRINALAALPERERHLFYGRVVESVFAHPAYQRLVFETAAREFDAVYGQSAGRPAEADLRPMVEKIVRDVLASKDQDKSKETQEE